MLAGVDEIRAHASGPLNLNFFCHTPAASDESVTAAWLDMLSGYYRELGLALPEPQAAPGRTPFSSDMCQLVEECQPEVVSFHFGLPDAALLERVRRSGALVCSSATTVREAQWLEEHGCDFIIAQGFEAGGHRGMFLSDDISSQSGTLALVPQVVDAVSVPVIAAGGIADARGIAAAFALGAAGVQIGTAYLLTPESLVSDLYRDALARATDDATALTNIFSGRPARGIVNRIMRELGPMSDLAPVFPTAGAALTPLKTAAEQDGRTDFTSLWAGQSAALAAVTTAAELTRALAADALECLAALSPQS